MQLRWGGAAIAVWMAACSAPGPGDGIDPDATSGAADEPSDRWDDADTDDERGRLDDPSDDDDDDDDDDDAGDAGDAGDDEPPCDFACDGVCVDPDVDPMHCGGCNRPCQGQAACVAGQCMLRCADDELECDFTCTDPSNDELHCGGCGLSCDTGVACVYGECAAADVHHILISGQSLALGVGSNVVSTEQPHDNVRFNTGVRAGDTDLTSFVPLVETAQSYFGETIASGMANLTTELAAASGFAGHATLASTNGLGSTAYAGLAQGTAPYATGLAQVAAGLSVATAAGQTYRTRAVALVHGERDHVDGNATYADDLLQWQEDYQADIQAATGQTGPIPLLLCQLSSFTAYGDATSPIHTAQLAAAAARPDEIFVVGPKYFLTYTADGIHLTGPSTRWLGEYYAKAVHRVLVDGEPWLPLSPRAMTVNGAQIRVEFHVPVPPLVLDTDAVSNPADYGFEVVEKGSDPPPTIVSVALDGPDAVVVTLSEPPGPQARLRYAYSGQPGAPAGPLTGARGNLRDSDATASLVGNPLWNWSVHFDAPVW